CAFEDLKSDSVGFLQVCGDLAPILWRRQNRASERAHAYVSTRHTDAIQSAQSPHRLDVLLAPYRSIRLQDADQDEELTLVQRCVLVTLMIKATALPNTFLRNEARIELKADKRRDLKERGLITVTEQPLVLELTEKGWGRAKRELGAGVPPGAG